MTFPSNAKCVGHDSVYLIVITAYEDEGIAAIPVTRGPGLFGDVAVSYRSNDISAISGSDYILYEGEAFFTNGESTSYINATILDDLEMEFAEQFMVELIGTRG